MMLIINMKMLFISKHFIYDGNNKYDSYNSSNNISSNSLQILQNKNDIKLVNGAVKIIIY